LHFHVFGKLKETSPTTAISIWRHRQNRGPEGISKTTILLRLPSAFSPLCISNKTKPKLNLPNASELTHLHLWRGLRLIMHEISVHSTCDPSLHRGYCTFRLHVAPQQRSARAEILEFTSAWGAFEPTPKFIFKYVTLTRTTFSYFGPNDARSIYILLWLSSQ
jgi:hypothetical protein